MCKFSCCKKNEKHIFGFEADEEIHMGILDVLFQSLNVEATIVSQASSQPFSNIGPKFEDVAPKQMHKLVAIDLCDFK